MYVSDITYIWTWEGWLFLGTVIDLGSRRVVGWSMADHMRTALVADALRMAIAGRRPGPGLIFHSERGTRASTPPRSSPTSWPSTRCCSRSRGPGSVGTAVAESFFSSLKEELIHRRSWTTRAQATAGDRGLRRGVLQSATLHSFLGYLSPAAYEALKIHDRKAGQAA